MRLFISIGREKVRGAEATAGARNDEIRRAEKSR